MILMGDTETNLNRDDIVLVRAKDVLYTKDAAIFTRANSDDSLYPTLNKKFKEEDLSMKTVLEMVNNRDSKNILSYFSDIASIQSLDKIYKKIEKTVEVEEFIVTNIFSIINSLITNDRVSRVYIWIDDDSEIPFLLDNIPLECADCISVVDSETIDNLLDELPDVTTVFIPDLDDYFDLVSRGINITNKLFMIPDYIFNGKQLMKDNKVLEGTMIKSSSKVAFVNLFDFDTILEPKG